MPVSTKHKRYEQMRERWQRCRDFNEGSDAVKRKGTKYLPALDAHAEGSGGSFYGSSAAAGGSSYETYKGRALLYNAMNRTVDGFTGAIFQKEPEVSVPTAIEDHLDDLDLAGTPLALLAQDAVTEVLAVGRYGLLVDIPSEESPQNRPYWITYAAEDITNWSTTRVNGDEILTRVILRECVEETDPEDVFATKEVTQYRVLQLVVPTDNDGQAIAGAEPYYAQQIWRQTKEGDDSSWALHGDPIIPNRRQDSRLPFIPFQFFGPQNNFADVALPPLIDLVDVNNSHYCNSADLEQGLHLTALPTPWRAGSNAGDDKDPLPIGPQTVWELSENGKAGMLEFTGAGIKAIREVMADKQKMMATLGARLLEEQPRANETATAYAGRQAGEHATLRTIAGAVERGLTQALKWHAWWVGTEERWQDVDADVKLNKDFLNIQADPQMWAMALNALMSGEITRRMWWHFMKTGDMTPPGMDFEGYLAELYREGVGDAE